jgi:hypothetical protein
VAERVDMRADMVEHADEVRLERHRITGHAEILGFRALVRQVFEVDRPLEKLVGGHVVFDQQRKIDDPAHGNVSFDYQRRIVARSLSVAAASSANG